MLAAHAQMIGTDRLRFDHSLLMNRPAAAPGEANSGWGRSGRKWHAHPYDQDGWGVAHGAQPRRRSARGRPLRRPLCARFAKRLDASGATT